MKPATANRKGASLRISEIYSSRQGEGLLTGTPCLFIRTSGCNLRCWFCDTPFASWEPEGEFRTIDSVVSHATAQELRHVVVTGGEPLLSRAIVQLCSALKQAGMHLTIETAGTIFRPVECDLMSISPKLSSSTPPPTLAGGWQQRHEARRERLDVVQKLIADYDYQLKFVIDQRADCREVLDYLARLGDFNPECVLLMPQGTSQTELESRADWLRPWCQEMGFRFCRRAHIEWYGNRRGT